MGIDIAARVAAMEASKALLLPGLESKIKAHNNKVGMHSCNKFNYTGGFRTIYYLILMKLKRFELFLTIFNSAENDDGLLCVSRGSIEIAIVYGSNVIQ